MYCKVLDLRTATPRGEVSMTRLLGSRERGAHPELQLGLKLETPGEQPPQQSLSQWQHIRWDQFSCSPACTVKVLDLQTARPRGEVSMTRLLGSRERGASTAVVYTALAQQVGQCLCSVRYWICGRQHPMER